MYACIYYTTSSICILIFRDYIIPKRFIPPSDVTYFAKRSKELEQSVPKSFSIKMEKDICCKIKYYFIALFCRIAMHSLSVSKQVKP